MQSGEPRGQKAADAAVTDAQQITHLLLLLHRRSICRTPDLLTRLHSGNSRRRRRLLYLALRLVLVLMALRDISRDIPALFLRFIVACWHSVVFYCLCRGFCVYGETCEY